jgi:hypothetical protein
VIAAKAIVSARPTIASEPASLLDGVTFVTLHPPESPVVRSRPPETLPSFGASSSCFG